MSAVVYAKRGTSTASGGTFSVTIPARDGICKQIVIQAATATTTFDFTLTDIYSLIVLDFSNITGRFTETLELPTYGNWTLTVNNASANEVFTHLFCVLEGL